MGLLALVPAGLPGCPHRRVWRLLQGGAGVTLEASFTCYRDSVQRKEEAVCGFVA